jgi:hypothetical protein
MKKLKTQEKQQQIKSNFNPDSCKYKPVIENGKRTWAQFKRLGKLNPLIETCLNCNGDKRFCTLFPPKGKKIVRAYLANQFGFSETGRHLLETLVKPKIMEMGILINDPFIECGKELDYAYLAKLEKGGKYSTLKRYWQEFSLKVTPINNRLMQNSDCMITILDGGHALDDGVSSEIGYYAGIARGPIFALRSDFRLAENITAPINTQVYGYILQSKGMLATVPDAIEKWFSAIKEWHAAFIAATKKLV